MTENQIIEPDNKRPVEVVTPEVLEAYQSNDGPTAPSRIYTEESSAPEFTPEETPEVDPVVAEVEAKENAEPPKCPKCGVEVKEGTFELTTLGKKMRIDKTGKFYRPNVAICNCGQDLGLAGFTPVHVRKDKYPSPKLESKKRKARQLSNKSRKANRNK